jgi:hypothetical protein
MSNKVFVSFAQDRLLVTQGYAPFTGKQNESDQTKGTVAVEKNYEGRVSVLGAELHWEKWMKA